MDVLGDFIDAVAACPTVEAVGALVAREIARHGYTSSTCGTAISGEPGERRVYFRNWRLDWAEHDARTQFSARSPVTLAARRATQPFASRVVRQNPKLSAKALGALNEAEDFGWIDGLVVPVHGPGGRLSVVSMATGERDVDVSAASERRLASIALLAFQRCDELSPNPPLAADGLTPRELECLRWAAMGKTDGETGMILGISQETAKYHVEKARARLNAATRAHAVAKIALAGLL
jgi:LuxR family quorum sensing-dependent transcriptional regulator